MLTPLLPQISVMPSRSTDPMKNGSHSLSTMTRKSNVAITTVATLPKRNIATCIFSLDIPKLSTAP